MTRREKAMQMVLALRDFAARQYATVGDHEVERMLALAEEYDDLVAFYDAAIEEGLDEANEAHLRYQEGQGG
jgi:hypothetical protein